jgi:hypothetical protein
MSMSVKYPSRRGLPGDLRDDASAAHRPRARTLLRTTVGVFCVARSRLGYRPRLQPGTLPIAYLDVDIPRVFWTDATFASNVDFYPRFSRLHPRTLRNGHALAEGDRDELCSNLLLRLGSVERDQRLRRGSKVHVLPFGANLAWTPEARDIDRLLSLRVSRPCRRPRVSRPAPPPTTTIIITTTQRQPLPFDTRVHLREMSTDSPTSSSKLTHGGVHPGIPFRRPSMAGG